MDEKVLQERISAAKECLVRLARKKRNNLKDPEVYQKSCELDCLVVEYTKMQMRS